MHPQAGLLPDFSLSVRSMPTWGSAQYLALLLCALLLAHLLGYHLWRAKQEGPLRTNPNPESNPGPNPGPSPNPKIQSWPQP